MDEATITAVMATLAKHGGGGIEFRESTGWEVISHQRDPLDQARAIRAVREELSTLGQPTRVCVGLSEEGIPADVRLALDCRPHSATVH